MPKRLTPLSLLLPVIALFALAQACAQSLQITAPANGTIVHPGETLSVTVSSTGEHFKAIALVGPDPIGFHFDQTGVPAVFTIKIPPNTFPGKYMMTANGVTASGQSIDSDTVDIDVERTNLPVKLSFQMPVLYFRSPDGSFPLMLSATFPDGSTTDVTHSSKVTYRSANPAIAQMSEDGIVTAKSPGNVQVIGTYTHEGRKVEVAVAVNVAVGPVASSAYSLQFPDRPVGGSSDAQHVILTAKTLGPLRILDIKTSLDFSESDNCRVSALKTRETCTIDVKFQPKRSESREGQLTITNDFGSGLTISLAGTGK